MHLILLKQGMGVEERDVEEGAIQAEQTLQTLERGDTGDEETRSDIIAEKTVQVTNEEQHIDWEGYGLRLHIQQNSLPENCTQFQLKMAVSRAKECTLPTENGILVSAVYSFNHNLGDRKLRRPATLEMQHCVVGGSNSSLCIVQSNEISPPFMFSLLQGGKFDTLEGYASVELDHFCSFGVYLKWFISSLIWNLKSCAVLYYTNIRPHSFQFHLYIAPQLDAILKVCLTLLATSSNSLPCCVCVCRRFRKMLQRITRITSWDLLCHSLNLMRSRQKFILNCQRSHRQGGECNTLT